MIAEDILIKNYFKAIKDSKMTLEQIPEVYRVKVTEELEK